MGDLRRLARFLSEPLSVPVVNGIPRFTGSEDAGQQQTADAFGFKWAKRETYDSPEQTAFARRWAFERYGFEDAADARAYFEAHGPHLDLGCGSGYTAALWMDDWQGDDWVGVDISDAVDVARERLPDRPTVHFVQADLMDLPFRPGSFATVFSEGVLHHTPSTRAALAEAASMVAPGGELLFYVYRRKAPIREFTDDYVRDAIADMSPADAWDAMRPLTELGRVLSGIHATVELPDGVPVLGIPPGRHDVQRLIYWNVAKLFWNDDLDFEANVHINFDWYSPRYAHRQSEAEVRAWLDELGMTVERFHVDEAGYTVRARRSG